MIRTNLATRPFYNERLVNLWLLALAAVVVAATIFNVTRARSDSGSNTELASQAAQNAARATELRRTAAGLRASLDAKQLEAVSVDAREANDLIDRRTFSWTALFNRFETTLPDDVRITSVRPTVDRDHTITLTIHGRGEVGQRRRTVHGAAGRDGRLQEICTRRRNDRTRTTRSSQCST